MRDWLYVEDHCEALLTVVSSGKPGETYNIGGNNEKTNLELVELLCSHLDELRPRADGRSYREQITFVQDRPGHDLRYAIDASKYGGSWAGLRTRTIPPGSGKPFSGIWSMRTGGGESCPGNTVWNVWEPMARKLI